MFVDVARVNRPAETRRKVLRAGYKEFRRYGFQGASLNRIVATCGVTKGAMFHHYGSKAEIGYEVLKQLERERLRKDWLVGIELGGKPVGWLRGLLDKKLSALEKRRGDLVYGSLVWNLATEMGALDEGFRELTTGLYQEWIDCWAGNLQRAQSAGQLSDSLDCVSYARFLVNAVEGLIAAARIDGDLEHMRYGFDQLVNCLAGMTSDGNRMLTNASDPAVVGSNDLNGVRETAGSYDKLLEEPTVPEQEQTDSLATLDQGPVIDKEQLDLF